MDRYHLYSCLPVNLLKFWIKRRSPSEISTETRYQKCLKGDRRDSKSVWKTLEDQGIAWDTYEVDVDMCFLLSMSCPFLWLERKTPRTLNLWRMSLGMVMWKRTRFESSLISGMALTCWLESADCGMSVTVILIPLSQTGSLSNRQESGLNVPIFEVAQDVEHRKARHDPWQEAEGLWTYDLGCRSGVKFLFLSGVDRFTAFRYTLDQQMSFWLTSRMEDNQHCVEIQGVDKKIRSTVASWQGSLHWSTRICCQKARGGRGLGEIASDLVRRLLLRQNKSRHDTRHSYLGQ